MRKYKGKDRSHAHSHRKSKDSTHGSGGNTNNSIEQQHGPSANRPHVMTLWAGQLVPAEGGSDVKVVHGAYIVYDACNERAVERVTRKRSVRTCYDVGRGIFRVVQYFALGR